jgi:hypothetical protein
MSGWQSLPIMLAMLPLSPSATLVPLHQRSSTDAIEGSLNSRLRDWCNEENAARGVPGRHVPARPLPGPRAKLRMSRSRSPRPSVQQLKSVLDQSFA